jgi:hypothetical protein
VPAVSETGIHACDLEPPLRPGETGYPLIARFTPLSKPGTASPRPRYVPGPLPAGMARVVLNEDYYTGPGFTDYHAGSSESPCRVFDIPQEQRDRWQAASDAYYAMQEEIEALIEDRSRNPRPVPSPGLPPV